MPRNICELPEECLLHILSLTSPEGILRLAALSKEISSLAFSDDLWRRLLPSDYEQIVKESSSPLEFKSLKDLFVLLYRSHLLFDENRKSISLDKTSLKKCYMLGSRSLDIYWRYTPEHWIPVPGSRFADNALMEQVWFLIINGYIPIKLLSENTIYGAYLVFNLTRTNYTGFERVPVEVFVTEVNEKLYPLHHPIVTKSVYLNPAEEIIIKGFDRPVERADGWMEIEMGTHQVGSVDDPVVSQSVFLKMKVQQIEIVTRKSGLLIQGMELRPLH